MQQPDLCMALPFSVSQFGASSPTGRQRCRAQLKHGTAATSYKNSSATSGNQCEGGTLLTFHYSAAAWGSTCPAALLWKKNNALPLPTGRRASRGLRRGEAESLPGVWRWGDGERQPCVWADYVDLQKDNLIFMYPWHLTEKERIYISTDIYVKMRAGCVGGEECEASHCSRGGPSSAALNLT